MRARRTCLQLLVLLAGAFAVATDCAAGPAFPLSVAPGGHHLEDAAGKPFLIHGDTAWSLIAQLRRQDVDRYLADRRARGFNAILVSLIERRFASNAPRNAYGEAPFIVEGDFSRPNEAYFAHVDWVLTRAAEEGFLVLLTPSYAGFNGGEEGWYRAMVAAGPTSLRRYGEYLGRRYSDFDNIIWVQGGDYDVPDKSLVRALAEGIRAQDPDALQTSHGSSESSSLDHWSGEGWLTINAVYTYAPAFAEIEEQRKHAPMPFFLIESIYENEHGATGQWLRMQAYQSLLLGAAGQVFGNNPIWHFDGPGIYSVPVTWEESLESEGARSMTHLRSLIDGLAWWTLVPDQEGGLLVGEQGPRDARAVAAAGSDGAFALVYLPSRREIEVDLSRLVGPRVLARWYDPAAGRFSPATAAALPADGVHRFGSDLAPNASGQDDWILLLESRS